MSAALKNSKRVLASRAGLIPDSLFSPRVCRPEPPKISQFADSPTADAIVAFIHGEMLRNAQSERLREVAALMEKALGTPDPSADGQDDAPGLLFGALLRFRELVKKDGPWDYKKYVKAWWGVVSRLDGGVLRWDMWGNLHYGFIGVIAGMPPPLLREMAGVVQLAGGFESVPGGLAGWLERVESGQFGFLAALDDPLDQQAVQIGIELADGYGAKITLGQLQSELRTNLHRVNYSDFWKE